MDGWYVRVDGQMACVCKAVAPLNLRYCRHNYAGTAYVTADRIRALLPQAKVEVIELQDCPVFAKAEAACQT